MRRRREGFKQEFSRSGTSCSMLIYICVVVGLLVGVHVVVGALPSVGVGGLAGVRAQCAFT